MRKKRLERELNHPHFVGVRLSDIELELLDRKAEILEVSRSECLRKLLVAASFAGDVFFGEQFSPFSSL